MFSLGVLAYILIVGSPPFDSDNDRELFAMNRDPEAHIKFDEPMWKSVSKQCQDCVRKMMAGDLEQRPTVFDVLKHPWLENEGGEEGATTNLQAAQMQLRSYLARRKLKKGITAVMAMTRLRRMSSVTPKTIKRSVEKAAAAARKASMSK